MDRPDKEIQELRWNIPSASTEHASVVEAFQNATLRPIIKLQHEVIIELVKSEKTFLFAVNTATSKDVFRNYTGIWLQKRPKVKNQLIGLVIGMMTTIEIKDYQLHSGEYDRRITSIVVTRVADTLFGHL